MWCLIVSIPDSCPLSYSVIFLSSGDENVTLSLLFSKITCCIQYELIPEATYSTGALTEVSLTVDKLRPTRAVQI